MNHQVDVIAHHRVAVDTDGEDLSQRQQPIFHPLPTMFEAAPRVGVDATQPSPAHAARDAMEGAWLSRRHDEGASGGHKGSVPDGDEAVCRHFSRCRVGIFRVVV